MELPRELKIAIEKQLEGKSLSGISGAVSDLSESYRVKEPAGAKNHIRSSSDADAYIAYRMPATYAADYSAIDMVRQRMPDFVPETMLDAGAGPGTAMWAAAQVWPEIKEIILLERDPHMTALGKSIAAQSQHEAVKSAQYKNSDITGDWGELAADLVICSYVINELSENARKKLVERLWQNARGALLIIEPGTKQGYANIKNAREQLIALGAKTAVPCPHDKRCPLDENDWCHFSQRVARTSVQRRTKGGELSYEDEKFSFLCMAKSEPAQVAGVVIRHPQIRKGCIEYKLCTPDGIKTCIVTHKDREKFREARDMKWGSIKRQ